MNYSVAFFLTSSSFVEVFTVKLKLLILLHYNSLPYGTNCHLGWPLGPRLTQDNIA